MVSSSLSDGHLKTQAETNKVDLQFRDSQMARRGPGVSDRLEKTLTRPLGVLAVSATDS